GARGGARPRVRDVVRSVERERVPREPPVEAADVDLLHLDEAVVLVVARDAEPLTVDAVERARLRGAEPGLVARRRVDGVRARSEAEPLDLLHLPVRRERL